MNRIHFVLKPLSAINNFPQQVDSDTQFSDQFHYKPQIVNLHFIMTISFFVSFAIAYERHGLNKKLFLGLCIDRA